MQLTGCVPSTDETKEPEKTTLALPTATTAMTPFNAVISPVIEICAFAFELDTAFVFVSDPDVTFPTIDKTAAPERNTARFSKPLTPIGLELFPVTFPVMFITGAVVEYIP